MFEVVSVNTDADSRNMECVTLKVEIITRKVQPALLAAGVKAGILHLPGDDGWVLLFGKVNGNRHRTYFHSSLSAEKDRLTIRLTVNPMHDLSHQSLVTIFRKVAQEIECDYDEFARTARMVNAVLSIRDEVKA